MTENPPGQGRHEIASNTTAARLSQERRQLTDMTRKIPGPNQLTQAADIVADQLDADVIHFVGPLERPVDTMLIDACLSRRRRTNVFLILVTLGGNADAAYRVARCLQDLYADGSFILFVSGICKSAGTLVAIGAHELVISDHGELGPLDVQMSKKDELWEYQSGLAVMDALTALKDNAFNAFEQFFLDIKRKSGDTITLRTATEIATDMTKVIFAPLYAQIDPIHIGEAARAMSIAGHYGKRLLERSCNIDPESLDFILSAYPSHGFVIDRREAEQLFVNVREPDPTELLLAKHLGPGARWPSTDWKFGEGAPFNFLSTVNPETQDQQPMGATKDDDNTKPREAARSRRRDAVEEPRGKSEEGNGNGGIVSSSDTSSEIQSIAVPQ